MEQDTITSSLPHPINISGTGAIAGATGITSSGTITFSCFTADRAVFTTTGGQLTTIGTSTNLASSLSDETGTGVAVFGTSPTLTTSLVAGSASFDLLNTTATTVNAFGAATTLNIGANTGTATINNAIVNLANGALQTGGTERLSNGGALSNITGYTQTSGAFTVNGCGAVSPWDRDE